MSPRPKLVAVALLGSSVVMMGAAWGFQSEAAGNLASARSLAGRDVEGEGPSGEVLADYRAVLESLNESIELRSEIDAMLSDVEAIIVRLEKTSDGARATADASGAELEQIASVLGGAVTAARTSFADLRALREALTVSAGLADQIADELEELDGKLGPGAP